MKKNLLVLFAITISLFHPVIFSCSQSSVAIIFTSNCGRFFILGEKDDYCKFL